MVLATGLVVDDAIVAMTLTPVIVYAPLAFITETIGRLFIEFAVALAGSVLVSGVVSIMLSPQYEQRLLNNMKSIYGQRLMLFRTFNNVLSTNFTSFLIL